MPIMRGLGVGALPPESSEDFPGRLPQDAVSSGNAQASVASVLPEAIFKTDTIISDASEFY
jgi:hypothetical protein